MLIMLACTFYALATAWLILGFSGKRAYDKWIALMSGALAVLLHAYLLHHWIDVGNGQNLSGLNLFSLVTWLVSTFVILLSLRHPTENVGVFIFPLALLSILATLFIRDHNIVQTTAKPYELPHILLGTLTLGVLCLAGLQAVITGILSYSLRHKQAITVLKKMPPLETMETLLFQLIWTGFVLLNLEIITSLVFFSHLAWFELWHKTALAIGAWCVFAVLLSGRYFFGWRGRKIIAWTLLGLFMLIVIYLGSVDISTVA